MKLSELLEANPSLDTELNNVEEGDILVDGVYLFRIIRMDEEPGEANLYFGHTEHTDPIIRRGLVKMAEESFRAELDNGEDD